MTVLGELELILRWLLAVVYEDLMGVGWLDGRERDVPVEHSPLGDKADGNCTTLG